MIGYFEKSEKNFVELLSFYHFIILNNTNLTLTFIEFIFFFKRLV